MSRSTRVCVVAALLAVGCSGGGGTIVNFTWVDGEPDLTGRSLYFFVRVEERKPGELPNTLRELQPQDPYRPGGLDLTLPAVPFGDDRVVIVEVRESPSSRAPIAYYGISVPFSFHAGDRKVVDIALQLQLAPRTPEDARVTTAHGVRISTFEGLGRVATPTVTLALVTDRGIAVRISNRREDLHTKEPLPLSGLARGPDLPEGFRTFLAPWDLDRGLASPCVDLDDCPRRVFVQFVDAQGYPSGVADDGVILDTHRPALQEAQVVPDPVAGDARLQVNVVFKEPLRGLPRVTIRGAPSFPLVPIEDAPERSAAYTLVAGAPSRTLGRDGEYSIDVTAIDIAGNRQDIEVAHFTLDDSAPDVAAGTGTVSPPRARAGTVVRMQLESTEALPELPVLHLGPRRITGVTGGPTRFQATHVIDAADEDGPNLVTAQLTDRAGNSARAELGTIFVDRTGPSVEDVQITPSLARATGAVRLTITTSEILAGWPRLVWANGRDPGFGSPARTGLAYMFTLEAAALPRRDDSFVLAAVELTDPAGNFTRFMGPPLPRTFAIDATIPRVDGLRVTPERIDESGEVEIRFRPSEDVGLRAPNLEVTIGAMIGPLTTCRRSGAEVICTYAMTGRELLPGDEQAQGVVVRLRDASGNEVTESASVVFDFDDPGVQLATIAYLPGSGNVLSAPRRAKAGTTVSVTIVTDEPIDPRVPPSMIATRGTSTLTFTLVGASLTAGGARFEAVVPDGLPNGVYVPKVRMTDEAGNTNPAATFGSPQIEIKATRSTLLVDQERLLFVRSPWGLTTPAEIGGLIVPAGPHFELVSRPDTAAREIASAALRFADTDIPVEIRISGERTGGVFLGRMRRTSSGNWERAALPDVDIPRVFVSGVDDAGNESTPVPITHSTLIGTPNGTGLRANPNRLTSMSEASEAGSVPTPDGQLVVDLSRSAPGLGIDGTLLEATSALVWQRRGAGRGPPSTGTFASDLYRGELVAFGGLVGSIGSGSDQLTNELWTQDGSGWSRLSFSGGPSPRASAAAAWDARRRRVVIHGGVVSRNADSTNETWEWDGTTWQSGPPSLLARRNHRGVYDAISGEVLFVGGIEERPDAFTSSVRIWAYDGARWRLPRATTATISVIGSYRGRVMGVAPSDGATYKWGGDAWRRIAPPGPAPTSGRGAHDVERDVLVVAGTDSTWEWNGSAWRSVAGPPEGGAGSVVYSARDHAVIAAAMVLASAGTGYSTVISRWTGSRWLPGKYPAEPASPSTLSGLAAAHDARRGVNVVLVADETTGEGRPWEWNAFAWSQSALPETVHVLRHLITYDPVRQRLVMVATDGRPVFFDGNVATYAGVPGPVPFAAPTTWLEWEAARQIVLAVTRPVGGTAQVFQHDLSAGGSWAPAGPSTGAVATLGGFAVSNDGARVLVHGGASPQSALNQLWRWDGGAWRTLSVDPNLLRRNHTLTFDASRRRAMLFGGSVGSDEYCRFEARALTTACATLSEWDGTAWTTVTPNPALRVLGHAASFDAARDRLVIYGGTLVSGSANPDVWELPVGVGRRPGLQLDVDLARSFLPAESARRFAVRAVAAARGGGSGAGGVSLLGWLGGTDDAPTDAGAWVPLAVNGDTISGEPARLDGGGLVAWSSDRARDVRAITLSGTAHLQIRPNGTAGANLESARVGLDAIVAGVEYDAVCRYDLNPVVEREPNDFAASANLSLVSPGSTRTIAGSIRAGGDIDVFAFRVPAGERGTVVARTYAAEGNTDTCAGDTVVSLVDANGVMIAQDDDGGFALCSLLDGWGAHPAARSLPAGTYFIQVRAFSATQAVPSYLLDLAVYSGGAECLAAEPTMLEAEPNDTRAQPNISNAAVGSMATFHARLAPAGDVDWYEVVRPPTARLVVRTYGQLGAPQSSCNGDTVVTLYSREGTVIAEDDDGGFGVCSQLEVADPTSGGELFLAVRHFSATGTLPSYFLDVELQ